VGDPFIAVRALTFRFTDEREAVFENFHWEVERGASWAVIGPSGCGKSTLLYLLAGLRQPTVGDLLIDGFPVPRPRATTGLILQNHGLLPWATVYENAALGLRMGQFYRDKPDPDGAPRPYPPALPLAEAHHWLERLSIHHLCDKYPAQLSGGQRQRVAIARTLSLRPNLLLMDEPFSALDAITREDLQDLVVDLRQELGVTTIVVTHNVEEAAVLGRHILVLHHPPNRRTDIVDNAGAGTPGYRGTTEFLAVTRALRERLGGHR
jgi:NitT/TauT family transport system ATP-binding protein